MARAHLVAWSAHITLMIDSIEHVQASGESGTKVSHVRLPLCLDIDMAFEFPPVYILPLGVHSSTHCQASATSASAYPSNVLPVSGSMPRWSTKHKSLDWV